MDRDVFYCLYLSLDLRPITSEFVTTCMHTLVCTNCQFRHECLLRLMFYLDDLSFEIYLQSSEIKTEMLLSTIAETENTSDYAFLSTEKIRLKRKQELSENSNYSVD